MKKLSFLLLALLSTSAFANTTNTLNERFKDTKLEDIFTSGHGITVTVTEPQGLVIYPGNLYAGINMGCFLKIKDASEASRILSIGRKIKLIYIGRKLDFVEFGANDSAVQSLVLQATLEATMTLRQLEDSCRGKFDVEPNEGNLEEI